MPAGTDSTAADPHHFRSAGLPSVERPTIRLATDRLPTGTSVAPTGIDCARCGGRGAIYVPSLLRELSCPDCR